MKIVSAIVAVLLLTGALGARSSSSPSRVAAAAGCAPMALDAGGTAARIAAANNQFGFRLLRAQLQRQAGNVFISPTSAAIALEMIYDGARGSTRAAMSKVLGLHGMTQAETRAEAAALLTSLVGRDQKVQLDVADSLWARKGTPFDRSFLQQAQSAYGAEVHTLDFSSPQAATTINSWVSCATHGKIGTMIQPPIPAEMVLYLLNAVYFHGLWTKPFDPRNTRMHSFTTGSGRKLQIPLMTKSGLLPYYQQPAYTGPATPRPSFQMVSLPYGSGRFSMIVVLPRRGLSTAAFARQLAAHWGTWISRLGQSQVELGLPRFTLSQSFTLNKPLAALGMGIVFSPQRANLSGMCSACRDRLYLSEVKQKTYLGVDEKGTTASAATSGGIATTAMPVPVPPMIVDHPFFLAIRDSETGALLFLGRIDSPTG